MIFPWILSIILLIFAVSIFIKLLSLKRNINHICTQLKENLSDDSNTVLTILSRDRYIKKITIELNKYLALLHTQRQKHFSKEIELQESMTNISHDLRTPLTSICGYLELLETTEKSETACHYVDIIQNRAEYLKQLIEELFQYSVITKQQNLDLTEPISINHILENSISKFYDLLQEKNIQPNIYITDKKVIRNLNQVALTRVFENLLSNMIKYSDGDFNITLTEIGEIIFSNTASELNEVQVAQLFNRFYTVKNRINSTGLGLTIAKTLIEQMNGTISAKYKNNKLYIYVLL